MTVLDTGAANLTYEMSQTEPECCRRTMSYEDLSVITQKQLWIQFTKCFEFIYFIYLFASSVFCVLIEHAKDFHTFA